MLADVIKQSVKALGLMERFEFLSTHFYTLASALPLMQKQMQ